MLDKLSPRDVLLGLFLVGAALYWWLSRRKFNLPPGPIGVPLLGYLPFLSRDSQKDFIELQKKYGDVFSLYLGNSLTVVLNEFKNVKEAFDKPTILDRPHGLFDFQPDGFGFLSTSGTEWMEQRRYTMRILRDIGLGKSGWIGHLDAEVNAFVRLIENNVGRPVNLLEPLSASVSSNITSLIFGERYPMGDPRRKIVDDESDKAPNAFLQSSFPTVFPGLATFIAKLTSSKLAEALQAMKNFNRFVKDEIRSRHTGMAEGSEEIYIDEYLREIEKRKGDPNTSFNEKGLVGNSQAMVIAGSETTRTSITWLLFAMAEYQDLQNKVQEEIDRVLGKDGKCSWMERNKLPYTYATIMECQRWRTVVPLGVVHSTSDDTKIGGYDVPKGARVISNIWALHTDTRYWKEPEKFIPERFLLEDGTVTQQRLESYAPFSVGRRICPGEFVALVEILHYFTAVMQRFRIQTPKGRKLNLEGISGGTYFPVPQELLFTLRD